jgi:hypothetical protein
MIKPIIFYILFYIILSSCGQTSTSTPKKSTNQRQSDIIPTYQLLLDTNRIVILPVDTTSSWYFKWLFTSTTSAKLTNQDNQTIEALLEKCLSAYITLDSSKLYSYDIVLRKYNRQYVPYTDLKGEKKVFVNCICTDLTHSTNWRNKLLVVDDGGSCFFEVTINLTTLSYAQNRHKL